MIEAHFSFRKNGRFCSDDACWGISGEGEDWITQSCEGGHREMSITQYITDSQNLMSTSELGWEINWIKLTILLNCIIFGLHV